MFRQIVKSAIDKGRLKFVETPRDEQSIPIGPSGKMFLNRLLQDDSFKDEKVKTAGDGIKFSSKEVVQEHNENILEGMSSIEDTMKTPRTGGNKKIQRSMQAKQKEIKAAISTSTRNPRSLLHSY